MASSSGYNLNPFPYFPPSSSASYSLPLSVPSLLSCDPSPNTSTTFNFHQTHLDPLSFLTPYFPIAHFSHSATPEALVNFTLSGNNIPRPPLGAVMGKKDRHSKIYTSQGLRDRRVRLSIDIARKFFDLQDMLGYDKASKTLEWLFSKSTNAIKELSRTKYENFGVHGGPKKMCFDSDDEEEEEEAKEEWGLKMKSMYKEEEEKVGNNNKVEVFNLLAKESRAKARARARERTMEKKQVNENRNNENDKDINVSEVVSDHWSKQLNHQSSETSNLSSFKNKRKISSKKLMDEDGMKPSQDVDNTEITQWKLLDHEMKASKVKRKWMPSIVSGSSQRNLLISIDGIPINLTQNWDGNSNPTYPFSK